MMGRLAVGVVMLAELLAFTNDSALAHSAEPAFGDLTRLADKYGTDKGSSTHNYTDVYEYFLMPMRSRARRVFEIGVASGASLLMWRDFFPKAMVYGIDIEDSSRLDSGRISTFIADQGDRKQLGRFITKNGAAFDMILDDGGHTMEQQQISLGFLFPDVKPGGYYILEDVHTSLMYPGWGIDPDRRNTTLAMIESFIRTGRISSKYMTPAEARYVTEHVRFCSLFKGADQLSITWIVRKK
jgi:predicted O-methyltransferase YrrM